MPPGGGEPLRSMPASIAATSFSLIPIFGLGAASLFGEHLSPTQWAGATVVIAAVAAVGLFQRRLGAATGWVPQPTPSSAAASAQIAITPRSARRR